MWKHSIAESKIIILHFETKVNDFSKKAIELR